MVKRILITGASSGIGKAASIALAHPDHHLILVARRTEELEAVVTLCKEKGGSAEAYPTDLTDLKALKALATRLHAKDGYPVLINSAGIGVFNEFAKLAWEDVERQMTVNMLAPAKLIHDCLPLMLE